MKIKCTEISFEYFSLFANIFKISSFPISSLLPKNIYNFYRNYKQINRRLLATIMDAWELFIKIIHFRSVILIFTRNLRKKNV